MAWKRTDWNAIIDKVNALIANGCSSGIPLIEVPVGHKWSVADLVQARNTLTAMCSNAPTFSVDLKKWSQAAIDELNNAINNCQCSQCLPLLGSTITPVLTPTNSTSHTVGLNEPTWGPQYGTLTTDTSWSGVNYVIDLPFVASVRFQLNGIYFDEATYDYSFEGTSYNYSHPFSSDSTQLIGGKLGKWTSYPGVTNTTWSVSGDVRFVDGFVYGGSSTVGTTVASIVATITGCP